LWDARASYDAPKRGDLRGRVGISPRGANYRVDDFGAKVIGFHGVLVDPRALTVVNSAGYGYWRLGTSAAALPPRA
jgi:hypothetical protein